jgi:NCS1 family nucleobase:cation symporter-1
MSELKQASDQVWSIEQHGIEHITDEERHGSPFELFWIWFASNVGILGIVYGAILFGAGLNLWQSIGVTLIGSVVSFALVGVISISGVRGGAPMLTLSRAAFGPRGNIGPTLISWISLIGWETVIVVTAAYALLGLLNLVGLPSNAFWTVVSLVLVALLVVGLGLLGHATLVWIQRAATWLFGILTLIIAIFLVTRTNWTTILAMRPGPWDSGVLAMLSIIAAGTGIGWVNAGADYTRYLPRSSSSRSIIWWTIFGATLPLFVLIMVGVLLSSRVPNLASASNPIQIIGSALPAWMAVPYLITSVGGLVVAADLDIYSSGLNLLALGVKAQRYKTVLIDGVLMIAGSIFVMLIAQNFLGPFESFLQLLADGLTAWSAVFLVDMLRRRTYDGAALNDTSPNGRYYYRGGVNWPGFVAWLVGILVGLAFTASPFFNGPFATGIFASSSLGYLIAFFVSAILYAVLMRFNRQGESTAVVEN